MKKGMVLSVLCVICGWENAPVCVHPSRGRTSRVSLDRVARAQQDLERRLATAIGGIDRMTLEDSYDSGLPACRRRRVRRLRAPVPRNLVGRTMAFGPAHRLPAADVRVATSARSLLELKADGLAHPELVRRLDVKCTPTRIRFRSEDEYELVENP